jgi:ribosomal protein S18 acetylase RimI-like enzyme
MPESRDNDEVLAEPPAPQAAAAALTSRALAWTYHEPEWMGATEERWAHGTIYRHPEFPNLSDLNSLRVREATTMTAPELFAFAEDKLGRYVHRRIHFDSTAFAAPHREYFAARGFMTFGLTLMHFEGQRPAEPDPAVREVEYDTVAPLRVRWHHEDFGEDDDPTAFHAEGRIVHMRLGERTLAVFDDGQPIAFAGLDLGDDELEIAGLYVVPEHRGHGLGTALTQSALASAGTEYVWICAEEAGRPKHLYARLGFRPVLTTEMFLRLLPQAD